MPLQKRITTERRALSRTYNPRSAHRVRVGVKDSRHILAECQSRDFSCRIFSVTSESERRPLKLMANRTHSTYALTCPPLHMAHAPLLTTLNHRAWLPSCNAPLSARTHSSMCVECVNVFNRKEKGRAEARSRISLVLLLGF